MVIISEKYAEKFRIMFNPNKSKLLCYNMLTSVVLMLCGEIIDVVHFEKHLGKKLYVIFINMT